jgi:hypothetical protein
LLGEVIAGKFLQMCLMALQLTNGPAIPNSEVQCSVDGHVRHGRFRVTGGGPRDGGVA